jgi:hypothetical protein
MMKLVKTAALSLSVIALAVASGNAAAQQQGVTKTEILVGSILDISGPIAALGKQTRNGMQLRVDEINEQGGIHGRKIKLMVEDDGYDPKKAVLAAQKLVNQDKVFVVAGHRHRPEQRGHADPVREGRDQLPAGDLGSGDVRALPQAEVLVRRHLLRPDARRLARDHEAQELHQALHHLPG